MRIVNLLGRRDSPTDALDDYCACLAAALGRHGVTLESVRVGWAEDGWFTALRRLRRERSAWRGKWVLVQYTALAWSRRGVTLGFLLIIRRLRRRGAKIAIVFHDPLPFPGVRFRDRVRRLVQEWVLRRVFVQADCCIAPVVNEQLHWLPALSTKARFIPVGTNIVPTDVDGRPQTRTPEEPDKWRIITVFGITPGPRRAVEIAAIHRALQVATSAIPHLELIAFGRGTADAAPELREALKGLNVRLSVLGLIPELEISTILHVADVHLDVRAPISSRRGSAIAAIAHGVPIVGYSDAETDPHITETGVRLVPAADVEALSAALLEVLSTPTLHAELRRRSLTAYVRAYSWDCIAQRLIEALESPTIVKDNRP